MVEITFITAEGESFTIDAPTEGSVMEAAKNNQVPGIEADCGGSMVCGTCHVVISPQWQDKLPGQSDIEAELLEYVPEPQPNTRLSCQLPVTDELDGIVITIPKLQR